MSPVGRDAPVPIWNEKFALKLPHPTSVLEVHLKAEDVDGEVSKHMRNRPQTLNPKP